MTNFYLDTNVFVRFLTQDSSKLFHRSKSIFEKLEKGKSKAFLSILVVNELIWILENYYSLKRKVFIPQIIKILNLKNIKIIEIRKAQLFKILEEMIDSSFDFTDLYLDSITDTNKIIVSFDKDFDKLDTERVELI